MLVEAGTEAVPGRRLRQETAGGTWFARLGPGKGETGQNQGWPQVSDAVAEGVVLFTGDGDL